MKSAWFSIRAFVMVYMMVVYGTFLCALALIALQRGERDIVLLILGGIMGSISTGMAFYFASPTGAGGEPHSPTT
uniref:Uncharacterized protein n=1 Tax=viral metagenome TaxID=1070528 RepID=A0A6H1ZQJ8_9ZZZZ